MKNKIMELKVDTKSIVLSSASRIFTTETFNKQTRFISSVDFLVSKIAESIMRHFDNILYGENLRIRDNSNFFVAKIKNQNFSFTLKLGYQIGENFNDRDIVFVAYNETAQNIKQNDQRFVEFLRNNKTFEITLEKQFSTIKENFKKVYHLFCTQNFNLPLLNDEQKKIVETIDQNILVQGVAGSGKTNICIEKIIYSACRGYGGRVLYSTYSRGLLLDTKLKIQNFAKELGDLLVSKEQNKIVFLDANHKKALENKFGILFFQNDDDLIFQKVQTIVDFLQNNVDYFLIEDIYKKNINAKVTIADENFFSNNYLLNLKNHQIRTCFDKLSDYSVEIIFKEIFGMILGKCNIDNPAKLLSLDEYVEQRKESFSQQQCECIYKIAQDYQNFMKSANAVDINTASRQLLQHFDDNACYTLTILDEVQDFSEVNLCLFKKLSVKMFCVGDALQMINPSYFRFGYLKSLLFDAELSNILELKNNYRTTKKIEEIINNLGQINKEQFGTHNFVVDGKSVDSGIQTQSVFVSDANFAKTVSDSHFDDFTFVVANAEQKSLLRKIITNQEILTVSEIKGLERNTIVTYNILSDNFDKWQMLERNRVNHKQADENSIYRYYYNLLYVGISRAKQNLFVVENKKINMFDNFFKTNFDNLSLKDSIDVLTKVVSKLEFNQNEILERVSQFTKLEQYDNARFMANKIKDDLQRINVLREIDIYKDFICHGDYKTAGIRFWEFGMVDKAREQFLLAGEDNLVQLLDACAGGNASGGISYELVSYYPDILSNKVARDFVLDLLKKDCQSLKNNFASINNKLQNTGRNKNGK